MSGTPHHHTFSIENTKIPGSEEVFGAKFAGNFAVRRPSLADKQNISIKKAAAMTIHGTANPNMISQSMHLNIYIFAFLSTVATAAPPDWFDAEKIFSDKEELAVHTVWQEVSRWLKESFPE